MEFPKIQSGQFVVIHAEKVTGIILDAHGNRNLASPLEWMVFNSLDEAENYCNLKIAASPSMECNIFNHLQERIKTVPLKSF